jgi:hypothetical protein
VLILDRGQLPDTLRSLPEQEWTLLEIVTLWGTTFNRAMLEVAATLERLAQGLREVQAMCEREENAEAVADRLLQELA